MKADTKSLRRSERVAPVRYLVPKAWHAQTYPNPTPEQPAGTPPKSPEALACGGRLDCVRCSFRSGARVDPRHEYSHTASMQGARRGVLTVCSASWSPAPHKLEMLFERAQGSQEDKVLAQCGKRECTLNG